MKKYFVFVVCLILVGTLCFCACDAQTLLEKTEWENYVERASAATVYAPKFPSPKQKAVIILPGFTNSSLYSTTEKDADGNDLTLWRMDGLDDISANAADTINRVVGTIDKVIATESDGVPCYTARPGNTDDPTSIDATGKLTDLYDFCVETFVDYDVVPFQYDWRIHMGVTAVALDNFIKTQGYKSVVLIGHSMGCCVASAYLALGKEQRDKTELFVAYGGPMLGSVDATLTMFTRSAKLDTIVNTFMTNAIKVKGKTVAELASSIAPPFMMSVGPYINSMPYFKDGETFYSVNGEYKSYEDWKNFVYSHSWAYNQDGTMKFFIKNFDDYVSTYFVDGIHVSRLVHTEYIASIGITTAVSMNFDSNGKIDRLTTTTLGDSVVPLYSATAGITWNGDNVPENIHLMTNCTHMNMPKAETGGIEALRQALAHYNKVKND